MSSPNPITAGLDRLSREADQSGLEYMWKNFESKLPDLLVGDATESKIGVAVEGRDQVNWVSTPEELRTALGSRVPSLLILNRHNSWSRIDATIEGFSETCHLAEVTPFFLNLVVGMGYKYSSKDEDFMSCYSTFGMDTHMDTHSDSPWEICYNIRHFERHLRDLEDPWSCRQSALHESFSALSKQPTWVVIQPPEAFDLTVEQTPHPMTLHIRYLHAAIKNWREYLDSFAQRFLFLNHEIALPNPHKKFKVNFSHQQHLHNLRGKLHHAQSILVNTRNTLSAIAEHESAVAQNQNLDQVLHDDFQRKLRNISHEVDNYIETSHKLLHVSDDLRSMYNNILTLQGQEIQHDTILMLAQLAQDDASGNKGMAVLADLTHKYSR